MVTSWTTSPNSMNNGRRGLGSSGIQTAALAIGGRTSPSLLEQVHKQQL
jgi:hypothetical protein